ncbi:hypothetical protein GCM10017673_38460 [Streptosporangium violaceochromogenes]|nr:hypothetical protein GCM10017673_38460 [Streptosporangium violaceochromogenes]
MTTPTPPYTEQQEAEIIDGTSTVEVAGELGIPVEHRGNGQFAGTCPWCRSTDFVIYGAQGNWTCHRCAESGRDALVLVCKVLDLWRADAVQWLAQRPARHSAPKSSGPTDHTAAPADPSEAEGAETSGCHRNGCTFEVVAAHEHGPIAIVCTGTCGRSWPVTPADNVAGYLVVNVRDADDKPWVTPQMRATLADAEADRAFWEEVHAEMDRGFTLRTAAVVLLPDKPGQ